MTQMSEWPDRLVLLGHPLGHSLSPLFQNAALKAAGIPLTYEPVDVPRSVLDETIASLNAQGVTITDGPTKTSSGSRFIFIDAPDGYEIELIERPAEVEIV